MKVQGTHILPLRAGTPIIPSDIVATDVRSDRSGFFEKLKKSFGSNVNSELTIEIRSFEKLIEAEQVLFWFLYVK